MTVLLPKIKVDNTAVTWKPMRDNEYFIPQYKSAVTENLIYLKNKDPIWSNEKECFTLNFTGKAVMASVKNFQLIDPNNSFFNFIRR